MSKSVEIEQQIQQTSSETHVPIEQFEVQSPNQEIKVDSQRTDCPLTPICDYPLECVKDISMFDFFLKKTIIHINTN